MRRRSMKASIRAAALSSSESTNSRAGIRPFGNSTYAIVNSPFTLFRLSHYCDRGGNTELQANACKNKWCGNMRAKNGKKERQNPHTQHRRMRHPNLSGGSVFDPPASQSITRLVMIK